MSRSRRRSSVPFLAIVAVLALVFGAISTSGVANSAAAVTKAKVKKIAKKQATKVVNTLAPTLSVASATNLNGAPAATYLDRVAYVSGGSIAVASGTSNTLLGPLSLTVPPGVNFVRLDGAATFNTADIGFGVYWAVDAVCSAANAFAPGAMYSDTSGGIGQDNASFHVVLPVTAGVHQYRLCSNNGAGNAFSRSLMVETVAVGATGGTTITKPATNPARPTAPGVATR